MSLSPNAFDHLDGGSRHSSFDLSTMSKSYGVQIFLACAFTSVSIHLLNQRRDAQSERLRHSAQIGALEDVLQRLRAGETVSDAEFVKIRRRVGLLQKDINLPAVAANTNSVEWKDSFMKRKAAQGEVSDHQMISEWNKAVRDSEASADDDRPSLLQTLFRNQRSTDNSLPKKQHVAAQADVPKQDSPQKPTQSSQNPKKPIFYY